MADPRAHKLCLLGRLFFLPGRTLRTSSIVSVFVIFGSAQQATLLRSSADRANIARVSVRRVHGETTHKHGAGHAFSAAAVNKPHAVRVNAVLLVDEVDLGQSRRIPLRHGHEDVAHGGTEDEPPRVQRLFVRQHGERREAHLRDDVDVDFVARRA